MTAFALCLLQGAAASPSRDLRGGLSSCLLPAARTHLTVWAEWGALLPPRCGWAVGLVQATGFVRGKVPRLHPDLHADCPCLAPGLLLSPDPSGCPQPKRKKCCLISLSPHLPGQAWASVSPSVKSGPSGHPPPWPRGDGACGSPGPVWPSPPWLVPRRCQERPRPDSPCRLSQATSDKPPDVLSAPAPQELSAPSVSLNIYAGRRGPSPMAALALRLRPPQAFGARLEYLLQEN